MKVVMFLISATLAAFTCGCAGVPAATATVQQVGELSAVKRDEFQKITSVIGPRIAIPNPRGDMISMDYWQLSGEKGDNDPSPRFFINFRIVGGRIEGWAFLKEMVDLSGKHFPLVQTMSEINGSLTYEGYYASVTREYLEGCAKSPKSFRLYGRRQIDVSTRTNIVDGFLQKAKATFEKQ